MDPLVLLVIFAVMMIPLFLMSSRQRKMAREQQEKLKQLEIGDEVRTHSGFFGLLVDSYDDVVILETESGAQTKWLRAAIAQKVETQHAVDAEGEAGESSLEEPVDDVRDAEDEPVLEDQSMREENLPSSLEDSHEAGRIGDPDARIGGSDQHIGEDPERRS